MAVIAFQVIGVFIFFLASFVCGKAIRRKPDLEFAKLPIRVVHFCYWFFLVLPAGISFLTPGLLHLDETLGLISLRDDLFLWIPGSLFLLIGTYYCMASTFLLSKVGRGAMAFKFSRNVVIRGVYDQVRNPMALGYYLMLLGLGLLAQSTYFFLFNLIMVIPAHLFYIKYFEEFEVELRLGAPYLQYKKNTPFLIPRFFNTGEAQQ